MDSRLNRSSPEYGRFKTLLEKYVQENTKDLISENFQIANERVLTELRFKKHDPNVGINILVFCGNNASYEMSLILALYEAGYMVNNFYCVSSDLKNNKKKIDVIIEQIKKSPFTNGVRVLEHPDQVVNNTNPSHPYNIIAHIKSQPLHIIISNSCEFRFPENIASHPEYQKYCEYLHKNILLLARIYKEQEILKPPHGMETIIHLLRFKDAVEHLPNNLIIADFVMTAIEPYDSNITKNKIDIKLTTNRDFIEYRGNYAEILFDCIKKYNINIDSIKRQRAKEIYNSGTINNVLKPISEANKEKRKSRELAKSEAQKGLRRSHVHVLEKQAALEQAALERAALERAALEQYSKQIEAQNAEKEKKVREERARKNAEDEEREKKIKQQKKQDDDARMAWVIEQKIQTPRILNAAQLEHEERQRELHKLPKQERYQAQVQDWRRQPLDEYNRQIEGIKLSVNDQNLVNKYLLELNQINTEWSELFSRGRRLEKDPADVQKRWYSERQILMDKQNAAQNRWHEEIKTKANDAHSVERAIKLHDQKRLLDHQLNVQKNMEEDQLREKWEKDRDAKQESERIRRQKEAYELEKISQSAKNLYSAQPAGIPPGRPQLGRTDTRRLF